MSRDLSRPEVASNAEAYAKAAVLADAAATLLWDAGRYVRVTMGSHDEDERGINYRVCRLVDSIEAEVAALNVLLAGGEPREQTCEHGRPIKYGCCCPHGRADKQSCPACHP